MSSTRLYPMPGDNTDGFATPYFWDILDDPENFTEIPIESWR